MSSKAVSSGATPQKQELPPAMIGRSTDRCIGNDSPLFAKMHNAAILGADVVLCAYDPEICEVVSS